MPSIFIFGLFPEDSGKTIISSALARGLINRGIKTCVFKPRSGHNFWHQYDAYLKCRKKGRLFCEDIIKLRRACKCSLPPEILNPVDALMSPLNTKKFIDEKTINHLYLLDENIFSHLIVERYTICENRAENIFCINAETTRTRSVIIDEEYLHKLESQADEIIYVNSLEEWNSVSQRYSPRAIRSCYKKISEKFEYIIIEGFNDAVCPDETLRYDLTIGVAPGVAIFYDAETFQKALRILGEIRDPKTLRARDVIKYLKKKEISSIPALPSSHLRNFDTLSRDLNKIVDLSIKVTQKDD